MKWRAPENLLVVFDQTHLGFALVVEREDVVSPARLALSYQKDAVSLRSRALDQVGGLEARDGPVEPWVGEEEVIRLLGDLLRQGEGGGGWRGEQEEQDRFILLIMKLDEQLKEWDLKCCFTHSPYLRYLLCCPQVAKI